MECPKCHALEHAHERGVIRRDFKSANVVITPAGRAKVLDFGLAKRLATGELGEAMRAVRNGDERDAWFRRDPLLAKVRDLPRFQQILDSIEFRRRSRI